MSGPPKARSPLPQAERGTRTAPFPRAARLLKHADFERVYGQGRRHFGGLMTFFFLPRESGGPRVGFTVGRVLGGAVERNRIKRRLREAVRLQYSGLEAAVDVVINPKKSVLRADFAEITQEIEHAFAGISGKLRNRRGERVRGEKA